MPLGLPLELVTMLGSSILGGLMSLWSMSLKAKQAQAAITIQALSAQTEAFKVAREHRDPRFQFTRRVIALTSVFSTILLPKLVAIFWPAVAVSVGYTEFYPGWFFGLVPGHEVIVWKTVYGLAITPLDTHLLAAVVGLYFGASICRNC